MNLTKIFRISVVMFAAALGYASPSHAQVSSIFFTTQANCAQVAGSNATAFTPGGTPVTVSLCMTTSAATCGHSIILQSAVGESGNFVVTQRTLGSNYSEANALTDPLPLAINNPAAIADFGGTSTAAAPNVAIPASANQLLATFTIAPQASAINGAYVLSLASSSIVAVVSNSDNACGLTDVPSEFAMSSVAQVATFTLNRTTSPPVFTSASSTTFSSTAANSFAVTATGNPTPTIAAGTLPTGVFFAPGVAGTGTLTTMPSLGAGGPYNITFTATGSSAVPQSFTLSVSGQSSQTITFPNPGTQPFSSTKITLTGVASSGLAITYSAVQTNPQSCSVFGNQVTMLQPGTCTVNANQAGNASFLAAPTMSQAFSISGNVPGAPTIGTAVNGIGQATISFTAPASTGGFPITSYTVSCGAFSASGPASPLTVTGLSNTNSYLCSASATNTLGTGPSSGTVMATPSAGATLALVGVQSRKLHAGVPFDQPIDWTIPITGAVSVEPRQIGVAGFNLIFQFNGPVTAVGGATSLDAAMAAVGTVSAPSIMPSGTEVSVTLTGVANGKRSTVTINGVNGAGVFTASMAFLIADVTGDRTVDVFDVIAVKAQGGKPIGQLNFTRDINADGTIDVFDLIAVKGKAGTSAP